MTQKLKRIFLIRHGESEGNLDLSKHRNLPDPVIPLTPAGKEQAVLAGMALADFIQNESIQKPVILKQKFRLWYSPYLRTMQTKNEFLTGFLPCRHLIQGIYQEPLLIEQRFGIFDGLTRAERQEKNPTAFAKMENYSQHGAWFFAKPPEGESQFDLYCRVKAFKDTLWRDALNEENPIENVIIISHGATIRAFMMDFLHKDFDWFDSVQNPPNASIQLIEQEKDGQYREKYIFEGFSNPQKIKSARHPYAASYTASYIQKQR